MGFLKKVTSSFKAAKDKATRLQKYENLSKSQLAALPDAELEEALDLMIAFKIGRNTGDEAIGRLKFYEQIYYVLSRFDAEVQNGGLCRFYVNESRETAPYVSDALAETGAVKIQKLYDAFNQENGINVNRLESFKIDRAEDFEAQNRRYPFDAFDRAYYSLYEEEPVLDLVLDYVRTEILK